MGWLQVSSQGTCVFSDEDEALLVDVTFHPSNTSLVETNQDQRAVSGRPFHGTTCLSMWSV
jgi:hypothetical protein